jgi:hypothetical protein
MARQTSVEVWKKINQQGLLPQMRLDVYNWLYRHGPATRNEVADSIGMVRNDASTRLRELKIQGVVYEVRERPCTVTGHVIIEWDVTANLPRPLRERGLMVREVVISVVLPRHVDHDFDEDVIEDLFPEMVDYDVRKTIRNAKDRELLLMRRQDGNDS